MCLSISCCSEILVNAGAAQFVKQDAYNSACSLWRQVKNISKKDSKIKEIKVLKKEAETLLKETIVKKWFGDKVPSFAKISTYDEPELLNLIQRIKIVQEKLVEHRCLKTPSSQQVQHLVSSMTTLQEKTKELEEHFNFKKGDLGKDTDAYSKLIKSVKNNLLFVVNDAKVVSSSVIAKLNEEAVIELDTFARNNLENVIAFTRKIGSYSTIRPAALPPKLTFDMFNPPSTRGPNVPLTQTTTVFSNTLVHPHLMEGLGLVPIQGFELNSRPTVYLLEDTKEQGTGISDKASLAETSNEDSVSPISIPSLALNTAKSISKNLNVIIEPDFPQKTGLLIRSSSVVEVSEADEPLTPISQVNESRRASLSSSIITDQK